MHETFAYIIRLVLTYGKFLLSIAFCAVPAVSHAEVIITEVAWMGSLESANDEWIEIYNFSNTPTDITGWTLTDGNSLNIALSGSMAPHEVFLLERTDDTTVPNVSASILYTGSLVNTGATLTIKDAAGNTDSVLVGGENWGNVGGDNERKYTPQLTMSGTWVTGVPTPGMPNIEEDADIPEESSTADEESDEGSTSGGQLSVSMKLPDNELSLLIEAPEKVYVHQEAAFSAVPRGIGDSLLDSLSYSWNFGDLTTGTGKKPTHMFTHPGEYVVVAEASFARHEAKARKQVTVLPVTFRVSRSVSGDITIHNDASYEIDLGGFTLQGDEEIAIPENTILLAKGSLTIPRSKLENSTKKMIGLYDGKGELVAMDMPYTAPASNVTPVPVRTLAAETALTPKTPIVQTPEDISDSGNAKVSEANDEMPIANETEEVKGDNTIQLAAAAAAGAAATSTSSMFPYLGLLGIMLLGGIALYTRRDGE